MSERENLIYRHVDWTAAGRNLSEDEKAKIIKDMTDRVDAQMRDAVLVPVEHLSSIYEALSRLTKLGQASIEDWNSMPKELADLKHQIFRLAEFPAVFAGQWLPREKQKEIYAAINTPAVRGGE